MSMFAPPPNPLPEERSLRQSKPLDDRQQLGMTPRAGSVRQSIYFGRPERSPIWYVNCDQTEAEAIVYH